MKEQVPTTQVSNLAKALQEVRVQVAEEIKINNFSKKATLQLALAELIKEQVNK